MITRRFALAALAAAGLIGTTSARAQDRPLVLFAAASLKNALDDASARFAQASGKPAPRISYAGSNVLAKQIEQGAPADLFLSADLDWMDYVQERGLIRADSRVQLLANRIVVVAPKDSSVRVTLAAGVDLGAALAGGRLAMGNVESVPAGKYGKAALEMLGAWDGVKNRLAQAENVRAALLLVSRGEAPLGIVYATDAAADPTVKIVATFPEGSHPPILYPVAVTRDSANADAAVFLAFLRGDAGRAAFERQGFSVLAPRRTGS